MKNHFILISEFMELLTKLEIGKQIASEMAGGDSHGHGHSHRRKRALDPADLTEQATWVCFIRWPGLLIR